MAERGIVPMEQPEHCPGAYVMHFYCKYKNPKHPFQRDGMLYMSESEGVESRTAAIRQIRQSGWIYHRDGTATCPICAAALRECAAEARGEA
ncbi:MAG TPA: hypothetical protein VGW34_03225 [Allosphingosinicella sp.]|nr:hypothetical protein [Allosphingosinicella sp.]